MDSARRPNGLIRVTFGVLALGIGAFRAAAVAW